METDVFFVAVDGSRKNIVRMMNAALRKFGIQEPITEDDDIETINHKLEVFSGRDGKDIGISDLLEEDGLQEWRFIEFVRVEESTGGLVAKFTFYLSDGFYDEYEFSEDAQSWPDIARQYECCVFLDDEFYRDARFVAFVSASIDDATDGELRSIHLDSGVRGEEFPIFLRTLAYMYPARYVPMWKKYHGEHPEVEYSREECLAWAEKRQVGIKNSQKDENDREYQIDHRGGTPWRTGEV